MNASHAASNHYDAIVIGGGCNGLTCAALLAKAGRRVVLLERRNTLGGLATGEEFHAGFRSVGPLHDTTRLRPGVIEALDLKRHGLTLTNQSPAIFAPQTDGPGLLLSAAPERAEGEVRAQSPHDARRYHDYRRFFDEFRPLTAGLADQAPPNPASGGFSEAMRLASSALGLRRRGKPTMLELLRITPMAISDFLGEWFESDLLKSALAMPALIGSFAGPRSPGTTANLLLHEALTNGRAVQGGPSALVEALVRAATAHGVEIRTHARVERITTDSSGALAVLLSGGDRITANVVAASCDPKTLFLKLLDPRSVSTRLRLGIEHLRTAGTVASVNLALNGPLTFACRPDHRPEFARIAPSLDRIERAFDASKYGEFTREPVLDLRVVSASDLDAPGAGHYTVSIRVPFVPYALKGGWSDKARDELGRAVIQTLARYVPAIESRIVAREVLTPIDLERRYGVTGGHLYHADHALDQLLARPSPECAQYQTPIPGLYLCSSGSWPGGGLTCAPGANAAREIIKRGRN